MLKDKITIKIESGLGGRGSMSRRASQSDGGNGGRGGDVYLRGSTNLYDLGRYKYETLYKADNGGDGSMKNRNGATGKDLILLLPLATEVYIHGELAYIIREPEQTVKLLNGGPGELGNYARKRLRIGDPKPLPRDSEKQVLGLVLKLSSDVIFIGYPNAGKSSMLNALTQARVKTAPYAFTTIDPQIGLLDGLRLMDLPGLIEGTYDGKGLGTDFVKHTENSKLVAHFVALDSEDPLKEYQSMREELKRISSHLIEKDEIVVLTKSDELEPSEISKIEKAFQEKGHIVVSVSIIDDDSIARLKKLLKEEVPNQAI